MWLRNNIRCFGRIQIVQYSLVENCWKGRRLVVYTIWNVNSNVRDYKNSLYLPNDTLFRKLNDIECEIYGAWIEDQLWILFRQPHRTQTQTSTQFYDLTLGVKPSVSSHIVSGEMGVKQSNVKCQIKALCYYDRQKFTKWHVKCAYSEIIERPHRGLKFPILQMNM